MKTIAVVPARMYSQGIHEKNLKQLGGKTLIERAAACGVAAGCDEVWVNCIVPLFHRLPPMPGVRYWPRPLALDESETPMLAVIEEMRQGGCFTADTDVILILQPTQPFRTPEHVRKAIALLQESAPAESVVSVVRLPDTHHPSFALELDEHNGELLTWNNCCECSDHNPVSPPTRRQDVVPAYRRDGTVYAFYRATVEKRGSIYGHFALPLIIDPAETCELDTEADCLDVERRWLEKGSS